MSRARLYLGILFAAPVTILTGLFYILPFWALGWYRYLGERTAPADKSPLGTGLVWVLVPEKAPDFLNKYWRNWGGHCVGSTVVLRQEPATQVTLNHELHHVHQMHKLGFFQPILYLISALTVRVAGEQPYVANTFEIAARRAAGQVTDPEAFARGFAFCKTGVKK